MINEIFAPSGLLKLLLLSVERKKESGRGKWTTSIIIVILEQNTHEFGFSQKWYLASNGIWPADQQTPCVIDCN